VAATSRDWFIGSVSELILLLSFFIHYCYLFEITKSIAAFNTKNKYLLLQDTGAQNNCQKA
jgi:hypothetical protein